MPSPDVAAVILAAGLSSRFGGSLKALRPLGGVSLLERMVTTFRAGGVENILVVTGHQAEECCALAQGLGVTAIFNQNYASGMFSSIQAGLSAAQSVFPGLKTIMVSPVDAALVLPHSVAAIIEGWRSQQDGPHPDRIIIPTLNGRHGHPVLLPVSHLPRILQRPASGEPAPGQDPDAPLGLRGYYHELVSARETWQMENYLNFLHPNPKSKLSDQCIIHIPLPDAGVLSDIDTAQEAASAESFLSFTENRTLPSVEEAWQLLCLARLSPKKLRHSLLVARGSLRLGLKLEEKGFPQNHLLLITSGLLHDVMRQESEHAVHAHALLSSLGWPKAAFVAGAHTRLPDDYFRRIGLEPKDDKFQTVEVPADYVADPLLGDEMFYAAVVVYMADKYARRDKFSTIAERFKDIYDWFKNRPGALEGLARREKLVHEVEGWLGGLLGCDLLDAVKTPSCHPLETTLTRAVDGIC